MVEVVFFDSRVGPDRRQQLILGHQPSGVLNQHAERVEHLQPQGDDIRAAREPAFTDIQLKRPESVGASVSRVAQ